MKGNLKALDLETKNSKIIYDKMIKQADKNDEIFG